MSSRSKNNEPAKSRSRERSNSRDSSVERQRSSRKRYDSSRKSRNSSRRHRSHRGRASSRDNALDRILLRLDAIENRIESRQSSTPLSHPRNERSVVSAMPLIETIPGSESDLRGNSSDGIPRATSAVNNGNKDATDKIVEALSALVHVRSQNFYISPFDPSIHDFDVWCAEVDRGQQLNKWDDRECLGRVGSCLRGDAKTWLNEWVTNDRSWRNFKIEFRSLCPRNIDIATVLYEVMCTSSNKYATYAEYARKSLLRLNIVNGLSDELKVAIVVRGLVDPQVKAAAANAKLEPKDLVDFLSVYTKPKGDLRSTAPVRSTYTSGSSHSLKREISKPNNSDVICHVCGKMGHKKWNCPKKFRLDSSTSLQTSSVPKPGGSSKRCSFCKRNGHLVESCFLKQRSNAGNDKNSSNVNFRSESNTGKIT